MYMNINMNNLSVLVAGCMYTRQMIVYTFMSPKSRTSTRHRAAVWDFMLRFRSLFSKRTYNVHHIHSPPNTQESRDRPGSGGQLIYIIKPSSIQEISSQYVSQLKLIAIFLTAGSFRKNIILVQEKCVRCPWALLRERRVHYF